RVLIVAYRLLRSGCTSLSLRRPVVVEHLARGGETDTIEVPHQCDHVSTNAAATAVPELFADVDGKSIGPAAPRAGADAFDPPFKHNPTPLNLAFNRDGSRTRDPRLEPVVPTRTGAHSAASAVLRANRFVKSGRGVI